MFPSRNHRPIIATYQSGNQIVCFTAAFCVLTQRSSTHTAADNRTTFLSAYYPIRFQLPFSIRCSRHVYTTVTPPSQLCFYRCPMGEWQNNKELSRQIKQSTSSVVAFESYSKFTAYEISSSSKQVEKMWSWLVEGNGQSPLLVSCSFTFKLWTLRLRAHISPDSLAPDQFLHRISVKPRLKVLVSFNYIVSFTWLVCSLVQRERNVVRFSAAVYGEECCVTTQRMAVEQTINQTI